MSLETSAEYEEIALRVYPTTRQQHMTDSLIYYKLVDTFDGNLFEDII